MTYEEAIEILKRNKPTIDPRICGKELCTACDVAIAALEKQTPKKPAMEIVEKEIAKGLIYPHCPVCDTIPVPRPNVSYCYNCGQAIDWSDK